MPVKQFILRYLTIFLLALLVGSQYTYLSNNSISTRNMRPTGKNTLFTRSTIASATILTGHFEYQNRQRGQYLPLAFALIEIRNATDTNICLGRGYTDKNGNLSFGPVDIPSEGTHIICQASATNPNVTVLYYWYEFEWSYTSLVIFIQSGQDSFTYQFADPEGAFTVFSLDSGLCKGWNYIYNTTGRSITDAKAYYPSAGPVYDNSTKRIHLPGNTYSYTDVILHEYAHYVMHCLFYNWYWPADYMQNHTTNIRTNNSTAWTEGWADFFPLVVKGNGLFNGSENQWDLENQSWDTLGWDDGDNVEGRVAGAMWDIYDSQNDSAPWYYDSFADGFNRIWNTAPIMCWCDLATFKWFWVVWNGTYYIHSQYGGKAPNSPYSQQDWTGALMAIFQNSIDYRGAGDANGDGKTMVDDILYVALRFGSKEGDPGWDKRADVYPVGGGDNKVRIDDVSCAQNNFGNKYDC